MKYAPVAMSFNGSPWIPKCLEALVLPSHFLTFEASKFPKVQEGAERRHGCSRRLKICLVLWQPRHGTDLAPSTACCLRTFCIGATCPHNTSGKMNQHKSTPKTRRAMTAINQLGKTSSTSAETSPCLYHPIHPDLVANPCATPAATCADTWGMPAEYKNTHHPFSEIMAFGYLYQVDSSLQTVDFWYLVTVENKTCPQARGTHRRHRIYRSI